MALYFPALSPIYRQATGPNEFRRRQVVSEHLKNDYKAGSSRDEELFKSIQATLASEGITITPRKYQDDKAVLRAAYLWLRLPRDSESERALVLKKATSLATPLVECLQQNGIWQWSDILRLSSSSPAQAEPQATSQLPPSAARVKLQESRAGEETTALINELIPRLEDILGENSVIKNEAERLGAECTRLSGELRDAEAYIRVIEQENTALEERLRDAKGHLRHAHGLTLEEIALYHPEAPQLLILAQQLKETANRRQEEFQQLLSRLPQKFTWANDLGKMVYDEQFLHALAEVTQEEQEQMVRQLGTLSAQGAEYASLHTRKSEMRLPYSPRDCLVSRGADNLRFTWSKKNNDVVVHWLYRKGDSRVRHSGA